MLYVLLIFLLTIMHTLLPKEKGKVMKEFLVHLLDCKKFYIQSTIYIHGTAFCILALFFFKL